MSQVEQDGFWEKVNCEDETDNEDTQPTPSPPAQDLDLDLPETGPPVNSDKQEAEAEGPLSSSQTSFDEKSLQHRSEDIEMSHDEDASERFGTAPMHPHREAEPETSHNNPSPTSNMDTNTTNNTTNTPKGGTPPQTPKNLTSGHNKQITEPEQPHAASVYRALLPTNMTCTLAPKLDQKGIEAENIKTTQEIDARLIGRFLGRPIFSSGDRPLNDFLMCVALREEWNDLSEKFENWADKGFEAQERRIRCQLRANLMQCAEKEQETRMCRNDFSPWSHTACLCLFLLNV
jgi:hypothetical protein